MFSVVKRRDKKTVCPRGFFQGTPPPWIHPERRPPHPIEFDFRLDEETGLVMGHGWTVVKAVCSRCHSLKLVIQNRGDRDTWKERIRWMQKTQGLWDLGAAEDGILAYLAEFYGASQRRRIPGLPASLQPR